MKKTGVYMLVGQGIFTSDELKVKLKEMKIPDAQHVIDQADKFGRWTDGKIRIMPFK